jgi:membrane protein required for colicin V production
MNIIDVVLLLPVALAVIRGYKKGLLIELVSFIALIVALIVTMRLTGWVLGLLRPLMKGSEWAPFLAYLITFLGTYILIIWAGKFIEKWIDFMKLGIFNRILGGVFGFLKTCFMISLLFWLMDRVHALPDHVRQHSFVYHALDGFASRLIHFVSALLPFIRDSMRDIEHYFKSSSASPKPHHI